MSTSDGSLGILARHAPSLYQLSPGKVDLISTDGAKSYFVSGGFVTVNPDSTMQIAAMEAVSLDQLDREVSNWPSDSCSLLTLFLGYCCWIS